MAPTGRDVEPFPRRPYAGAFRTLRVRGTARASEISFVTEHRFAAWYVETSWTVRGAGARAIDVLFPSWGALARVRAVLRSDERRAVGRGLALDRVAWFHVSSARSGYVVVVAGGESAVLVRPEPQASAPRPGPTLCVRARGTKVTARIAPARTAAKRLGA